MYHLMITAALAIVYITTAFISIKGFAAFFKELPVIYAVALALETGKLVAIIYIHREWRSSGRAKQAYYSTIIGILMLLTATEVLGFLVQTHGSDTKHTRTAQENIKQLETEQRDLRDQLATMKDILSSYPGKGYGSKKAKIVEKNRKITERLLQIPGELSRLKTSKIQRNENPVFSVAEIFGIAPGSITTFFICLVVVVLELLSVGLAVAASNLWSETGQKVGQKLPNISAEKTAKTKTAETAKTEIDQKWQNENGRKKQPEIGSEKSAKEWTNLETDRKNSSTRNGRNGESKMYQGSADLSKTAEIKITELAKAEVAETGPKNPAENGKRPKSKIGQFLEKFQKKYELTAEEIADITGRKKISTVEGWLEDPDSIPEKAARQLKIWNDEARTA